jgi:hypothetical protein
VKRKTEYRNKTIEETNIFHAITWRMGIWVKEEQFGFGQKKKIDRDRNRQNIKKRNIKERKALPFLVGEDDNERVFVRVLRVSFIGKFKRWRQEKTSLTLPILSTSSWAKCLSVYVACRCQLNWTHENITVHVVDLLFKRLLYYGLSLETFGRIMGFS